MEKKVDIPVELLQRIVLHFMHYGVKSVTMDDMARELGMSKKTLYKYFDNKDDMLYQSMSQHIKIEEAFVQESMCKSENAIDGIRSISRHAKEMLSRIKSNVVFDVKKYHPKCWQLFENHKYTFIYSCIHNNLKRGISEGLYRDDIDPDILARLYVFKMEALTDGVVFPRVAYDLTKVHNEFMTYHIRGIASAKGLKYLDKLNAQENEN